nr:MAG TPA: 4Fe-4S single cluster domain protein [Caudoviricetes sp.]
MGLFTLRFTHCSIECDKCLDGEIVNTGDMGTRTVEDVKKYWRSEGWRIGKVILCPACHHKKEA